MASIVSYLPSRICFSDCESYDSLLNMDFHQFNLRMKYDSLANPEIKGCKEEKLKEILDDLAKDFALAISDNTDNYNALSKQLSAEISTISISEFKQMIKGN